MATNYENLLDKLVDGHRVETLRNWINAFFVRKDGKKGLSANDYTDEDKAKVAEAATKAELEKITEKVSRMYTPKGSVDTVADLDEIENPEYGWVYNVRESGQNYVWCEGEDGESDFWDDLGGDLSEFIRRDEIQILSEEELEMILGICSDADGLKELIAQGGEVVLSADIAPSAAMVVTKDTVIDMQGHAMTGGVNGALFTVNGVKLTLKGGGEISNPKWIATVTNGGEVVIEDGTYETQNEGFKAVGSGSKITMNAGTVKAVECALGANQGAAIEMNGGMVETTDNMGIGTNGSNGQGGNTIIMNGGTVVGNIESAGYEAIGVYIANNDTFVMNGGKIQANGGTGLLMRAGYVTINDGEITATTGPNVPGWVGDKKKKMSASGIIYDEASNYPGKAGMSLTVNGGTITGADHAIEVLSGEAAPNVTVNGGMLTPAYPEAE